MLNEGDDSKLDPEDFRIEFQNEEEEGNKMFMILWLHAYNYKYKELTVKTKMPKWANPEYEVKIPSLIKD